MAAAEKPPHKLKFAVLATDTVLFTFDKGLLKVLLMKVNRPPFFKNHWGAPGGLIHPKETAEQSAKRHIRAKGGIARVALTEQLYTFSRVNRDPRGRVVSVAYLALMPSTDMPAKLPNGVLWFSVKKLPRLAYDHAEVIAQAIARLRAKLAYTNIAFALLPNEFTLGELQRLYETILGRKLDKRNFQKKFLQLQLIRKTGKKRHMGRSRPAELWRFVEQKQKEVEIL